MAAASPLDGILLIDKAQGWTSHDVVAKARRLCGQRRIGHTGTLDPMATGLLVLCLGQATRLVEYLTGHDKQYEGVVTLGTRTTTDDAEGEAVETLPVPGLDQAMLDAVTLPFLGEVLQVPPAFSAIKIAGRRAYDVARGGGAPEMVARPVRIDSLALSEIDETRLAISVSCGSGTYIRSLARDIGATLGCGGHLSALRRTRAGRFAIDRAVTIDELSADPAGTLEAHLLAMDEGMESEDAAFVTNGQGNLLASGGRFLAVNSWRESGLARIYDVEGRFIAIGEVGSHGEIRATKVFVRPSATVAELERD